MNALTVCPRSRAACRILRARAGWARSSILSVRALVVAMYGDCTAPCALVNSDFVRDYLLPGAARALAKYSRSSRHLRQDTLFGIMLQGRPLLEGQMGRMPGGAPHSLELV